MGNVTAEEVDARSTASEPPTGNALDGYGVWDDAVHWSAVAPQDARSNNWIPQSATSWSERQWNHWDAAHRANDPIETTSIVTEPICQMALIGTRPIGTGPIGACAD